MVQESSSSQANNLTRRDFIVLTASAVAGIGALSFIWPLASSLKPAADVLALASIEVNISAVKPGETIRVKWRGKPVFIRRRTQEELKTVDSVAMGALPDPESDEARVKKGHEEWLVVVGICTHLGCVPLPNQGDFGGWFCPCHGSQYDASGRIRKGPAPQNLLVPPYEFINENTIKIG